MTKSYMRWHRKSNDEMSLQLMIDGRWQWYNTTVYAVPDIKLGGLQTSKGFKTAQKMLALGWEYQQDNKVK
jgi:hypothetical protein